MHKLRHSPVKLPMLALQAAARSFLRPSVLSGSGLTEHRQPACTAFLSESRASGLLRRSCSSLARCSRLPCRSHVASPRRCRSRTLLVDPMPSNAIRGIPTMHPDNASNASNRRGKRRRRRRNQTHRRSSPRSSLAPVQQLRAQRA